MKLNVEVKLAPKIAAACVAYHDQDVQDFGKRLASVFEDGVKTRDRLLTVEEIDLVLLRLTEGQDDDTPGSATAKVAARKLRDLRTSMEAVHRDDQAAFGRNVDHNRVGSTGGRRL